MAVSKDSPECATSLATLIDGLGLLRRWVRGILHRAMFEHETRGLIDRNGLSYLVLIDMGYRRGIAGIDIRVQLLNLLLR